MSAVVKEDFAQMLREAEASGAGTACRVIAQFKTDNVLILARRAGVKIVYERWPLVTLGECERRSRTICVNLNAIECAGHVKHRGEEFMSRAIIAHELGHFFEAQDKRPPTDARTRQVIRERAAHGFAAQLLQVSCADLRSVGSHFKNACVW